MAQNTPVKVLLDNTPILIHAEPLTAEAFSPFGQVVENPRPDIIASSWAGSQTTTSPTVTQITLPHNAVAANQGSAIKYQHVSHMHNLYPHATGLPAMNLFSCEARPLPAQPDGTRAFAVHILERHPFTTQTFIPLAGTLAYLVVVAPTRAPSAQDAHLSVPADGRGRGLPDVRGLRAFVASARQAVTYGASTWHAPMVVLPAAAGARALSAGEALDARRIDFVVVQFASGEPVEDCQEVVFEAGVGGGVRVQLPGCEPVERGGTKGRATAKL